jgi:nucleoside-diphosphate-sugar epimerase
MRIVVIGGTGHVGTYLVPRLVHDGHEVISVSRSRRMPYQSDEIWKSVRKVVIDRDAAERDRSFGKQILILKPDIVIDMICFTPDSARALVEELSGQVKHYLFCGTIWVHGYSLSVPTEETQPRSPTGEYGINKAAIESYLLSYSKKSGFPATILHPGHIVGPGWAPVNPAGNFNTEVFRKLADGVELLLPNFGMETLHHVHADDVAQSFQCAINNFDNAIGESFHVVSPQAITLRGYAENIASWYGKTANLRFAPWDEWSKTVNIEDSNATWDHISHSPNCSIEKAKKRLNYSPGYSSLDAIKESLTWLKKHN